MPQGAELNRLAAFLSIIVAAVSMVGSASVIGSEKKQISVNTADITEIKKSVEEGQNRHAAMQVVVAQLAATSTANQQAMKEDIKYIIERLDEQAKDK